MLRNPGLRKSVEQPVLDLNFAASQIGSNGAPDGRMNDFNRGTNAWFVDSDGLVKKSPHNLLLQSEDFGTTWSAIGDVTVSTNEIVAPDGTTTADKISSANFAAGGNHIRQGSGTIDAGTYTASVFVKAGSLDTFKFRIVTFAPSTVDNNSVFNLSTGEWTSINAAHTVSTEAYPNDWFRLSLTFSNPASGAVQPRFAASSGSGFIYLWGGQLSQHSTLPVGNPYIKTEGSAVYAARLDHDPSWFMSAAQEQNLFTNSEMLDETGSTGWTATRTVVTKDSTEDPNGNTTAEKVLEDSTASNSHFVRSPDFTVTEGKSYTVSAYVKVAAGTDRLLRLAFTGVDSAFSYLFAQFDLQSGTVQFANADDSSITDVGNGWFRISVTETASATADTAEIQMAFVEKGGTASYDGDGTSGFFVWGAQVEVGTSPGTYHRTEGAPYYGPGATPKGLLIEEQRANLINRSETIGGTGWTNRVSGTATGTYTLNHALAPNGTVTATKADLSRDNTTQYVFTEQLITLSATGLTQGSCYIKAASSSDVGKELHFWQFHSGVGIVNQSIATLTSEWQRFEFVNTYSHGGSISEPFSVGLINNVGSELNVSVLLWGAQLEAGSFATSYIQTTGTALTRDADVATMGPTTGGTELVTNGTFDTDVSNWVEYQANSSITFSSGTAIISSNQYNEIRQVLSLVEGRRYRASMDVITRTSGAWFFLIDADGTLNYVQGSFSDGSTPTFDFTAGAVNTFRIYPYTTGNPDTIKVDNISVRELYPFEQYNPAEGTVVCEFQTLSGLTKGPFHFYDGTTNKGFAIRVKANDGGTLDVITRDASNFNNINISSLDLRSFTRAVASYNSSGHARAGADGSKGTASTNTISLSVDRLDIGTQSAGGNNTGTMSGHIRRLQYSTRFVSELEAQNLTSD